MTNLEKAKLSLKKNDQVQVIAGREKGKTGKVLKVDAVNGRIVIEGLNLVKRHAKATRTAGAGITEKESPISYSNVLLFCSKCNRGVRHGHRIVGAEAGKKKTAAKKASTPTKEKKVRVCKRCNEVIDSA